MGQGTGGKVAQTVLCERTHPSGCPGLSSKCSALCVGEPGRQECNEVYFFFGVDSNGPQELAKFGKLKATNVAGLYIPALVDGVLECTLSQFLPYSPKQTDFSGLAGAKTRFLAPARLKDGASISICDSCLCDC